MVLSLYIFFISIVVKLDVKLSLRFFYLSMNHVYGLGFINGGYPNISFVQELNIALLWTIIIEKRIMLGNLKSPPLPQQ